MKRIFVKFSVALPILGLLVFAIFYMRRNGLERSVVCTVVVADVVCETNRIGEIAMPQHTTGEGMYLNCKLVVREDFPRFLSGKRPSEPLLPKFMETYPKWRCEEDDVKSAFANLSYAIDGEAVAVVKFTTKGSNSDLALDVITFISNQYKRFVDAVNKQGEDKALMDVRRRIRLSQQRGGDVSRLQHELDEARNAYDRHKLRVYVLHPPTIL